MSAQSAKVELDFSMEFLKSFSCLVFGGLIVLYSDSI
jgi:hypothetical protein